MIIHQDPNILIAQDDALEFLKRLPDASVDLAMTSPPYEDARTYGIDFKLKGQEWVDWAVPIFMECYRVSKGLTCWVIEGKTRDFQWSATPVLFMADLHRRGVRLRKPMAFRRVGIPGSGGPDWVRNDWEFMVCATHGKLPWSDNTACGHIPKWGPGGEMSNRLSDGARVNQWGHSIESGATVVDEGGVVRSKGKRPSHQLAGRDKWGGTGHVSSGEGRKLNGEFKTRTTKTATRGKSNGDIQTLGMYDPPVLANPGNIIEDDTLPEASDKTRTTKVRLGTGQNLKGGCGTVPVLANPGNVIEDDTLPEASDMIKVNVGGGVMGSDLSHANEAPYPQKLCDFVIKSFCPPDGLVLDCFGGSGTTGASALRNGRKAVLVDVRSSQTDLCVKRIQEVYADLAKR